MANGTVKWFNAERVTDSSPSICGGQDVFVHYSAIDMAGYKVLEEGQHVVIRGRLGLEVARRPRPSAWPEPRLTEAPPFRPAALPHALGPSRRLRPRLYRGG